MWRSSPFLIVFWVLAVFATAAAGGLVWIAGYGLLGIEMHPTVLVPLLLLVLLYITIVAPVVYRDADRRGLDPWLWATVATFLPYLLGLVLYLVRRANGGTLCDTVAKSSCPGCGKQVANDWIVCPHCRHGLD